MEIQTALAPYPPNFPDLLQAYCRHLSEAKARNWHHDQRRALFMNFFREGFGVEAVEVELEHQVKVAQVRGFIDALYETTIFEFKTNSESI